MTFKEIGADIGALVDEKNAAYGNAFMVCGDFLTILYPNGVSPEQYTDMLLLVRMFDKMIRIANKKDAFSESPYNDLAGYSILGVSKDKNAEFDETPKNHQCILCNEFCSCGLNRLICVSCLKCRTNRKG